MKKEFDKIKVENHKKRALSEIESLIDSYIDAKDKSAELLNYWLEDYANFLKYESQFNPKSLKRYKRGEVIKAHLGYNIGSEEGGLHYCVVLDKENSQSSPVVTVVPLTSVKPNKDITKLKKGEVFLGSDLKNKMREKLNYLRETARTELHELSTNADKSADESSSDISTIDEKLANVADTLKIVKNIQNELNRMKNGSIALVGQITTISKIRIYEPKTNKDALSKIKLSNDSLTLIDNEIKKLFIY